MGATGLSDGGLVFPSSYFPHQGTSVNRQQVMGSDAGAADLMKTARVAQRTHIL